ncbi:MAG: methyltransferase [Thermoplasmata archaeon]|nr:methyltransferase [Thermoplasmata archaeon]
MRSWAAVVDTAHAEVLRRQLKELRLLRPDLRVARRDGEVWFPLTGPPSAQPEIGRIVEAEFEPTDAPPLASYRDHVDLTPAERATLPRSFDVVGDIVLIRLPETMSDRALAIGMALLEFVPGARVVGWDKGVHGPERTHTIERIAGEGDFRTWYRENGLAIRVDLERAYFSPRLAREHALVAAEVGAGEAVYDLCCGVGPFTLTIAAAGRAASIVAVDANPQAIELLGTSLARLPRRPPVTAIVDRLESFLPSAGRVQRVIVNLPLEGIKYAASVGATVAAGGVLYYYIVADRTDVTGAQERLAAGLPDPGAWKCVDRHVVHPYSPRADLVAFRFHRGDA